MTINESNVSYIPLEVGSEMYLSPARDRKRLIEDSFYQQLHSVYIRNGDEGQNNVPDEEEAVASTTIKSHPRCTQINQKGKFQILQPIHHKPSSEYQGKREQSKDNLVHRVNSDVEECATSSELTSSLQSETFQHEHAEQKSENGARKAQSYLSVVKQCVSNVGENAFGIAAIEIWTMRESTLVRCQGGYWRDPVYPKTQVLERLENPYHPEYVRNVLSAPGFGTAGKLWVKVSAAPKMVKWFDLYRLAKEDDAVDNPESITLNLLAQAFGLAMGMYFHNTSTNTKGIVIFYARSTVDFSKISSNSHLKYLRSSVDLMAAVVSWKIPREEAIMARQGELDIVWRRVKIKVLNLYRLGVFDSFYEDDDSSKGSQLSSLQLTSFLGEKMRMTVSKAMKGGGRRSPRPLAKAQVMFALTGSFLSLLTLSAINEGIVHSSDGDISILLGPLGALVTCHYGLTGSPAAQPRNSFIGILITSTIATASAYIPVSILPIWVRIPVVTSLGIATTLALGFTHPPAGAVAVIFAQESEPLWVSMGMLLFGYVEAILFAIIFINLYESSTFPMYWGIPNPRDWAYWRSKQGMIENLSGRRLLKI